MEMRAEGPSTRPRSRRTPASQHAVDDAAAAPFFADADYPPFSPDPVAAATACMRKRKRESRKRQDQGTEIAVYYGCRHEHGITSCVSAEELDGCKHVIGELPPHPQLMSFVDLQLWVFKLFRLHPETQDLSIRGFLKQYTLDLFDYMEHAPEWYLEYAEWENKGFMTDKCWRSFARKIKSRGNVVQKFMLYVSSSETKHYDALLKAANDGYSQLPPIVLAGKESLSRYNRIERQFGTFYDSYNYAPRFLRGRRPGAFVDIEGTEVPGCKDFGSPFEVKEFRVLHRIFWAFHECIHSFKYCRPVLCIKGVPLSGKYKGVLLTAVAIDANESALPVAYAVVEGETKQSWLWFLRNVKRGVVKERSGVCIIHDCKRELTSAIHDIKNNQQEPHPWRDVQSRWCMEHIAENFLAVFADEELMMMFKRLCQQKRESKFVDIWKELDKLTLKYMAEKEGHANAEPQQESVEHGVTELEIHSSHSQRDSVEDEGEGGDTDGSNNKIMKFSDWIRWKPMEKWSLLHDTNGARYGIMDSNVADVYNHVLKVIKCFPLAGIAELTFHCTAQYFKKTSAADDPPMKYPIRVQDDLNSELQKSKMYEVICMNAEDTNVYIGDFKVQWGQKSVIVHLNTSCTRGSMSKSKRFIIIKSAQCSCNKPQLLHKPCSHVIAVCRFIGVPAATYISPYHSLSYLAKTLSGEVEPYKTTEADINITPLLPTTWIPNKKLECYLPVSLTASCAETAMCEYEWQCVNEAHSKAYFRGFLFY